MSEPAAAGEDVLCAPDAERIATTNAWAFLHWLRARGISLTGWAELQAFSVADPSGFAQALGDFAGLADQPGPLARHAGARDALIVRQADGNRLVASRDSLLSRRPGLPEPIASLIYRRWPRALLVRPLAAVLLEADLRPDDRLLLAGEAVWPWLAALIQGTTVIVAPVTKLLAAAADAAATVIVTPAAALAEAAFRRTGNRPDLGTLRSIVATGGPLAPPERRRVYTWIKSELMLFARSGDTAWGNPLQPVLADPKPGPALFVRPPSRR